MKKFIPDLIRITRQRQRLSIDALIERMGDEAVSKMAVSKIERGLLKPSTGTLSAIAVALGVPIETFFGKKISVGKIECRYSPNLSAKDRNKIESDAILKIQNCLDFNDITKAFPKFENPFKDRCLCNYPDAEQAARELRRYWEIGLQPIVSAYELLQNYGIHIIEMELDDDSIFGMSSFVNDTIPVIIINTKANILSERKRFTVLHELAHILFDIKPIEGGAFDAYWDSLPDIPYKVTSKQPNTERLCDYFASALLLPESVVMRRIGDNRISVSKEELVSIRELYGISISAIIHRLHDIRIIDDNYYHKFYEKILSNNKLEIGWGEYRIKEQL